MPRSKRALASSFFASVVVAAPPLGAGDVAAGGDAGPVAAADAGLGGGATAGFGGGFGRRCAAAGVAPPRIASSTTKEVKRPLRVTAISHISSRAAARRESASRVARHASRVTRHAAAVVRDADATATRTFAAR